MTIAGIWSDCVLMGPVAVGLLLVISNAPDCSDPSFSAAASDHGARSVKKENRFMIAHQAVPPLRPRARQKIIGPAPPRKARGARGRGIGYETTTVGCAYHQVTKVERQLLETTARVVLKLKDDINDRVSGIEVCFSPSLAKGRSEIALARLRVHVEFLKLRGTPSAYLNSFVEKVMGSA
jgi:hypothetical protein